MSVLDLKKELKEKYSQFISKIEDLYGELIVYAETPLFLEFVKILKENNAFSFDQLIDITAVDYPERKNRFEVVYHFLSLKKGHRLRLKLLNGENEGIPSLVQLYPSACWWEREAWDMFGLLFEGTHDHRRILTDYGFEGHPLRKDFPVTGFMEVRYDDVERKVVHEPVKLPQAFRRFDFESPWEGVHTVLKKEPKDDREENV